MSQYIFKNITKVLTYDDYVNSLLSKTQRHTPTVIRRHFAISRIRKFYMVKVRYITKQCDEKFTLILEQFPDYEKLHPFYKELFDVLYDKHHYKIALGQINTLKSQILKVGADYTKLLKYGDSLFRCKQLKKAALGRIVTMIKKQKKTFVYLEDIRQHISRLPSIDPTTQSVILAGCPNVGKSSFMNLVSQAKPEIQPYEFTTKSLYVGHFDYDYIRWQVIDTPGLLDRPIDSMNSIELNAVTALGQIQCAVIFFVDVSESCGKKLEEQINVFNTVRPLFQKRPFAIACNKSDLKSLDQLEPEKMALLDELKAEDIPILELSTEQKVGVQEVKDLVCQKMMKYTVAERFESKKIEPFLNRVYVAQPPEGAKWAKCIPDAVLKSQSEGNYLPKLTDTNPDAKFEVDIEEKEGDFYTTDFCKDKLLENDEWKYDKVPQIIDGRNIADFYCDDIEEKLEKLLSDEREREENGVYDSDSDDGYTEQDEDFIRAADQIMEKVTIDKMEKRLDSGKGVRTINRASRARTRDRTAGAFEEKLSEHGVYVPGDADANFKKRSEKRQRSVSTATGRDGSKVPSKKMRAESAAARSRSRSVVSRGEAGMPNEAARKVIMDRAKKSFKKEQKAGRPLESQRAIIEKMPKWLYCGKRGIGKNERR